MKRRPGRERAAGTGVRSGRPGLRAIAVGAVCLLTLISLALAPKKKEKVPRVVTGIVVDGSENPIVGAVVEMTDASTGKKTAMYTQEGGHYQFSDLDQNRDYKIQATYKGDSSKVRTASSFDTRKTIRLNLQIPPPKDE